MILEALLGSSGVIGMALGGIFRLAPAVLEHLDKKSERAHELAMLDKQREHDALQFKYQQQITELQGQIALETAGMVALTEAIKSQGAPTGVKWVDALSASVRPILTYWWVMVLYTTVLANRFVMCYRGDGVSFSDAINYTWGPSEQAIVSSMITFWFLDRVIKWQKNR